MRVRSAYNRLTEAITEEMRQGLFISTVQFFVNYCITFHKILNMRVKALEVQRLIKQLATTTGQSLDFSGFGIMGDKIEANTGHRVPQRYLYERTWRHTKAILEAGESQVNLSLNKLDAIAQFLEFENFADFTQRPGHSTPGELSVCLGNWYSFVRCNSGKNHLLISPVKFVIEEQVVKMMLRGPDRNFTGSVSLKAGCICCTLSSPDKYLSMYFKIGHAKSPEVLQGTFAGISSAGEPIAGREVLIRSAISEWNQMKNWRIPLGQHTSDFPLAPEIIQYFHQFEGNYLKIRRPGSFKLEDLID